METKPSFAQIGAARNRAFGLLRKVEETKFLTAADHAALTEAVANMNVVDYRKSS